MTRWRSPARSVRVDTSCRMASVPRFWWPPKVMAIFGTQPGSHGMIDEAKKDKKGYSMAMTYLWGFEGSFRNEMSAVLLADAFATSWDVKKCMSSMAKKQVLWVARHLLITSGMIDLRTPTDKRGAGCRCISPFFHIPSSARSFQKRYSFSLARKIGSIREFRVDPIWSNPFCRFFPADTFEVWRAKTQWGGSPRKVPPATVFLGEERLASLTGWRDVDQQRFFFSRCFNNRQPNMERTYSDLREKILGI